MTGVLVGSVGIYVLLLGCWLCRRRISTITARRYFRERNGEMGSLFAR